MPRLYGGSGSPCHVIPVEPANPCTVLARWSAVERSRHEPTPSAARVSGLRQLARLLDAAVRIPGTNIRFGLDAVLGLIPGAGDIAGGVLSAFIVVQAANLGAPRSVL